MHLPKRVIILLQAVITAAVHGQSPSFTTKGAGSDPSPQSSVAGSASVVRATVAFDLPRLKAKGRADVPFAVPKGRATVHELSPHGNANARAAVSHGVNYIDIDGGTTWASEVRGAEKDITFVSFLSMPPKERRLT
jgi:hypothetical protein